MKIQNNVHTKQPKQHQPHQPGIESDMRPQPKAEDPNYKSSKRLQDKIAIISGGDSGIGRAIAIAFAKEGAHVVILYLEEHGDAEDTKLEVEQQGSECLCIAGDVSQEKFCYSAVGQLLSKFDKLDIVINNAAVQYVQDSLTKISAEQLEKTFRTNIFSYFYLTAASLPYLTQGSSIINTTSVTAYHGNPQLIDYSATKGAIVSFTRSLALSLIDQEIRVNAVAPGPIWTPLIPASFSEEKVSHFGEQVPMQRAGQPAEIAPCYVFLASTDASYITGQVLHPNGGTIING